MTIGFRFDIARGIDTLPPEDSRGRTHTREAGGGIRGICRSRTISGPSEKFFGAKISSEQLIHRQILVTPLVLLLYSPLSLMACPILSHYDRKVEMWGRDLRKDVQHFLFSR